MGEVSSLENHAEQFLQLSGDLFVVVGRDGYVREATGASTDVLGWKGDELRARPLGAFFHADDRAAVAQYLADLEARHAVTALQLRMATHSGTYRWMSLRGAYDGEKSCFYFVAKDIHIQREREVFSTLFFETASVGLNLCAMDGTWVESNPAFLKMIGYRKEDADGKLTYWRLTPPKYAEMERAQLEHLQTEGRYGPYEKEFVRADGALVPVRLNGFIIHKDGQPFIWSIIEDISTERVLEAEIEANTVLLEAIIDNIPTPLFVKDAADDLKFTLWNKAAEETLHRDRRDVIGKTGTRSGRPTRPTATGMTTGKWCNEGSSSTSKRSPARCRTAGRSSFTRRRCRSRFARGSGRISSSASRRTSPSARSSKPSCASPSTYVTSSSPSLRTS